MKDLLIEFIGDHIGQDWLNKLIAEAKTQFASKGYLTWWPNANNTLFELVVIGEGESQKPGYLLRFACDAYGGETPHVFSASIVADSQTSARLQRRKQWLLN